MAQKSGLEIKAHDDRTLPDELLPELPWTWRDAARKVMQRFGWECSIKAAKPYYL